MQDFHNGKEKKKKIENKIVESRKMDKNGAMHWIWWVVIAVVVILLIWWFTRG